MSGVTLLALDGAGAVVEVGLFRGAAPVRVLRAAAQASALPGMAEDLLCAHDGGVDLVVVGAGPGSFTGVRAAMGLAHGLAAGLRCALVTSETSDLSMLAQAGQVLRHATLIRSMGIAHGAAAAAIHRAAMPQAEAWREADFTTLLASPGCLGFFHDEGGVLLARLVADEAEVLTLAVQPSARRRGVGRALLEHGVHVLTDAGAKIIHLEVAEPNQAAQTLYENTGFRQVSHRKAYYQNKTDALLMSKVTGPGALPRRGRGAEPPPILS